MRVDALKRSFVALAYVVAMAIVYFTNETSQYLAAPFAWLSWMITKPFVRASLIGTVMIVDRVPVVFEDVCTGLLLVGLAAVFVWLRGFSPIKVAAVGAGVFGLNIVRVIVVILAIPAYGFEEAARIHDVFYLGFTTFAILISVYGAWPMLRGPGGQAKPAALALSSSPLETSGAAQAAGSPAAPADPTVFGAGLMANNNQKAGGAEAAKPQPEPGAASGSDAAERK